MGKDPKKGGKGKSRKRAEKWWERTADGRKKRKKNLHRYDAPLSAPSGNRKPSMS